MLKKEEIAPHVEDIARVLGDKIEKEEIEKELENYVNRYKVPLEQAKMSIVNKYGGSISELREGLQKTLNQLKGNESSVDLLCRVVSVNLKEAEGKRYFYGILGDDTATIPFTAWEDFGLEKGDIVTIKNAYTREWQGTPRVVLSNRSRVIKEADDALPPFDPSTIPESPREGRSVKIKDLSENIGSVNLTARVLAVEERVVDVGGESKSVYSGIIGDDTGRTSFSAWHDFNLKENEVIRISGAYVKAWRGPQVVFDSRSKVERLDDDVLPSADEMLEMVTPIQDIVRMKGSADATVKGVMIDIRNGSGLILRCPECRRVIQKNGCMIHGKIEGVLDLRVKGVVDDGTGALSVVFNKEITEKLLGRSIDECEKVAREALSREVIKEELVKKLVAHPMRIHGYVFGDDFGLSLIAKDVKMLKVDVESRARELLEEIE